MVRRQTYLSIILLMILVFAIGIIIGRNASDPGLSDVNRFIRQSELATESYLIEHELFAGFERDCGMAQRRLSELSNELWNLGKLLGTETAKQDLGEANYNFLKRKFHLMQIKTYTLYHELKQDCAVNDPVILFYYSQNDPKSQEQGVVLDKLVNDFDVNIFAIEYNYSQELRFLEEYYNISGTPAVVINFETMRNGLTSYNELMELVRKR